jgi:hypothetical protein
MPALLCGVLVLMLALQFALPVGDELPAEVRRVVPARLAQSEVNRVVPDPIILRSALFSPAGAMLPHLARLTAQLSLAWCVDAALRVRFCSKVMVARSRFRSAETTGDGG